MTQRRSLHPLFMTKNSFFRLTLMSALVAALGGASAIAWAQARPATAPSSASTSAAKPGPRSGGDYIVAVVGQELVTAIELNKRIDATREDAKRRSENLPPDAQLRDQVLEALISERVVLSHARDSGTRVDEVELDRAVQSVATQNKLTLPQLREQLVKEGLDYSRFRTQLREQMLVERVREREVSSRIKVLDADVDELVAKQRGTAAGSAVVEPEYNIAQILVSVPDKADDATVARQRAKAEAALKRVRARENFAVVAGSESDDSNRSTGGEIGLRAASRLPDPFVDAVRKLRVGEIAATVLQTGAGFHVLKLIEKREANDIVITQTRARHILMRASSQGNEQTVQRQLQEMKRQIENGSRRFEDLAKQNSVDDTAEQGGDLGFAPPGAYVPEFEVAMNALRPGAVSNPVVTRFGIHLIQVTERKDVQVDPKQFREQAKNALREQRFEKAYSDWVTELRARAYVEKREAP
jgi:peptidyl-prolyl cis-trans isomerase SurA